jgi:hypothetical protein
MPVPETGKEPAPFDSRTCLGVFVGWHTNPGSIFTGDYLVADFEKFKLAPDSKPSEIRVHRTKEVWSLKQSVPKFPLAEYREKVDSNIAADPLYTFELPPLSHELPPEPAPIDSSIGRDLRGLGEDLPGSKVRAYKGSTRPPGIPSVIWQKQFSPKEKLQAIAAYNKELSDAIAAATAAPSGETLGAVAIEMPAVAPSGETLGAAAVAMPAKPRTAKERVRCIVELCADQDSSIGHHGFAKGCPVVRITEDDNLLSSAGFEKANAVAHDKNVDDILYVVSLPCTGGCNWQKVNEGKSEESRSRVKELKRKFYALLAISSKVISTAEKEKPGCVSVLFELPLSNAYWKDDELIQFLEHHEIIYKNVVHGCAVGVVAADGMPILKPWRFQSTAPEIHIALEGLVCPKNHEHAICEGKDTKPSGHYPRHLALCIHIGFRKLSIRVPIKACPGRPVGDFTSPVMPVTFPEEPQEHREINPIVDLHSPSLVARKVPRKEVFMNKKAKIAMDDE